MATMIPLHAYDTKPRWTQRELDRLPTPGIENMLRSRQQEIAMDALCRTVRDLVRDTLSFEEWEVYFYRYIDLPYKRIAQITGRSEGALRQSWHTGIQKLRKAVKTHGLTWPEG